MKNIYNTGDILVLEIWPFNGTEDHIIEIIDVYNRPWTSKKKYKFRCHDLNRIGIIDYILLDSDLKVRKPHAWEIVKYKLEYGL